MRHAIPITHFLGFLVEYKKVYGIEDAGIRRHLEVVQYREMAPQAGL